MCGQAEKGNNMLMTCNRTHASPSTPFIQVWLLTGVTTEEELLSPDNKVHPDYFTDKLPDLLSVKQSVKA